MSALVLALVLVTASPDADTTYLYRAHMVRAAPGAFAELLRRYQERLPVYDAGGERPEIMRHRQGDQWDLMLLFPMESFATYYGERQRDRRAAATGAAESTAFERDVEPLIAWQEDLYVLGPSLEVVRAAFAGGTFFHVEMFVALPGRRSELLREREMENAFQAGIGRPETLIFRRTSGAAWDLFTVGIYADQPAWAASDRVPPDRQDAAARAAGFPSAAAIGPYLRSLMASHHDTLGSIVR